MQRFMIFMAAGAIAGAGVLGWQALRPAPEQAGHSMATPDTASIPEGGEIVAVTPPAELSVEARIGKRGFDAKCAECHGKNGAGKNGEAPPLIHKIYEPSHHGDAAFLRAAENGVRAHHWDFGNMPPVEGVTRADVTYIARYIREVQRANGID